MFFHHVKETGQYYVRMGDVPKGAVSERIDVPTDANGLAVYLSALAVPVREQSVVEPPVEASNVPEREHVIGGWTAAPGSLIGSPPTGGSAVMKPMDAGAILSRMDSPGVDVEGVVEAIAKARGIALRRYAGAVAIRFHELEKI